MYTFLIVFGIIVYIIFVIVHATNQTIQNVEFYNGGT